MNDDKAYPSIENHVLLFFSNYDVVFEKLNSKKKLDHSKTNYQEFSIKFGISSVTMGGIIKNVRTLKVLKLLINYQTYKSYPLVLEILLKINHARENEELK